MNNRVWLALECAILFIGLPALTLLLDGRMLVFGLLWAASFLGLYWMWRHDRTELFIRPSGVQLKTMLAQFAILGVLLVGIGWLLVPERFFSLPLERPGLFTMICLFYPLLSALPQEILYRAFFFAHYKSLFPDERVRIALSAIGFSLAHLVFANFVALSLALLGGALFAWRYNQTKSLPLAVLEHSLYGLLIFAIGLGWYFFLGAGHHFG